MTETQGTLAILWLAVIAVALEGLLAVAMFLGAVVGYALSVIVLRRLR